MLLKGQIDFAIAYPPLKHPRLSSISLSKERIVLAVPVNHPMARFKHVSVRDLRDAMFVNSPSGTHLRDLIDEICAGYGVTVNYAVEASYQEIYRLTEENRFDCKYLFFSPESTFAESFGNGYCIVRLEEKNMSMVTAISWLNERNLNLQYKNLVDHITSTYKYQETFHAKFTGVLAQNYKRGCRIKRRIYPERVRQAPLKLH